MKKAAAFAVAFLGLLLMLGSCVPAGLSAWRTFGAAPVLSSEIAVDAPYRSAPLQVRPNAHAQVAFSVSVATPSVQQEGERDQARYKPRYEFPFTWRAVDGAGRVLAEQSGVLDWKAGTLHVTTDERAGSTGATLTVEHRLEKFLAPADGNVVVEASLGTDTKYLARATAATIRLYDGMQMERWPMVVFVGMLLGGLVLAFGGFAFAVSAMAAEPSVVGAGVATTAADARRYAALCHVFALAGYLVPFGHIFGPLVAYLAFRRDQPFVAEQGREALNFNLSVTLYMAGAALSMLLLVGFLLVPALAVFHLAMVIVATVAASAGRAFRYPLTIRFVS